MRSPRFRQCLGPNVYPEVPEGGWGWAVALAFFVVEICTYGILKSLGVFLQDLMEEFGESNSRVSWVISISAFIFTVTGKWLAVYHHAMINKPTQNPSSSALVKPGCGVNGCALIPAAPLSTLLSNRFGYRPVVMMGGFLISLGTITSAFSASITEMYITVGLISGTCQSLRPDKIQKNKKKQKQFLNCV